MARHHLWAVCCVWYVFSGVAITLVGCGDPPAAPEYQNRGPAYVKDQTPPATEPEPKENQEEPPQSPSKSESPATSGSESLEGALRKALETGQPSGQPAADNPEKKSDAKGESGGASNIPEKGQGPPPPGDQTPGGPPSTGPGAPGSRSAEGSGRPSDPVDPTRPASPEEALSRAGQFEQQADRASKQGDVAGAYDRLNAALDALEAFPDDTRCRERASGLLARLKGLEAQLESRPGARGSGSEVLIDP
jgi:hypothetical protein